MKMKEEDRLALIDLYRMSIMLLLLWLVLVMTSGG